MSRNTEGSGLPEQGRSEEGRPEESRPESSPPELGPLLRAGWRLALDPQRRREARADLAEGWERRRDREGAAAADRWHRRQARELAGRAMLERLRPRLRGRNGGTGAVAEIRTASRGLARSPATTLSIAATLALALGSSLAVFALVHTVLLEPLPYQQPDRLTRIYHAVREFRWPLSVVDYQAIEEAVRGDQQDSSFEAVAASYSSTANLASGDVVERVRVRHVTPSYFPLLGLRAERGRLFSTSDGAPDAAPTVVLSHRSWRNTFGGDESVVGSTVRLDGELHEVVGVLAEAGPIEEPFELFPALRLQPPTRKGPFYLSVFGRLRDGAELGSARAEMTEVNRRLFPVWQASYQDTDADYGVDPLSEAVVGNVRRSLLLLLGAVLFVLAIAASNTANLLLTRAHRRSGELGLRAALGASRARLARLIVLDSGLLALVGAGGGLALAAAAVRAIRVAGHELLPRAREVTLDGPVLAVAAVLTLATVVLTGGLPAFQALRALRVQGSGGRATASATSQRVRRLLVLVQFAVALPLLIGAGLLLNSFLRLQRVDPGFTPERLLTASVLVHETATADTWQEIADRLEALPGIEAAGLADSRPTQSQMSNNFDLLERPVADGESQPIATWLSATPEAFTALGVPLLEGRLFDSRDREDTPPVAIVDRQWTRRHSPEASPLGQRFHAGGCNRPDCPVFTVVGVVGDVSYSGLQPLTGTVEGTIYTPVAQWPSSFQYLLLRTAGDPLAALPLVRAELRELLPEVPLAEIATGEELIEEALAAPRGFLALLGGFAIAATLLSLFGIYGVMAFFVQQQRREIGVRIALGGSPAQTLRLVLSRGLQPVLLGAAIGVAGALALGRAIASSLYDVSARDPVTIVGCSVLLIAAAALSCLLPARRAARVEPATVLRDD